MNLTIAPASECQYPGLHRAIDTVAREENYLAFTQAPPLGRSIEFSSWLQIYRSPHFVALDGQYHDVYAMALLR